MARPLRFSEPDAYHHVLNRAVAGRTLFVDDDDRRAFLGLLADLGPRWGVWCLAYTLLDDHYQLVLYDVQGRISRAMRHVDGVHTQRINRAHGLDGKLMRGRYTSRLVDAREHLLDVVRYVHSAPLRAGVVDRAGDHGWTSHRHVMDGGAPSWLRFDLIDPFVGGLVTQRSWFDAFVHEDTDPALAAQLAPGSSRAVVGGEAFVQSAIARRGDGAPTLDDDGERDDRSIDDVLAAASQFYRVPLRDLLCGVRGRTNHPRTLAMLSCVEHTPALGRDIAAVFGIQESSLTGLVAKVRKLVREDERVGEMWSGLKGELGEV